jgi:hypothetical protein
MRHIPRYLLLLLPCLVFPLSMTYAYNSASYDGFIRTEEKILPIPTLKVLAVGDAYCTTYAEPKTPPVIYSAMPAAPAVGMQFSLSEIDEEIMGIESSYMAVSMSPPETDADFLDFMIKLGKGNKSAKAKKVKEIVDKALLAAKFIDQLTGGDLVTMPLVMKKTIGEKEVSFVFNKARIYPQFTLLEVFVKVDMGQLDIEGNPVELFFAADDVLFSQEDGLIGGTIGLVNDYALRVGDSENAAVWLKGMTKTAKPTLPDGTLPSGETPPATLDPEDPFQDKYYDKGGTYVSFDCDGFKEMGIAGEVFFSRSWVLPTDNLGLPIQGTPANPSPRVRAEFSTTMQSTTDIFVGITMPNFTLTKYQNISLGVEGAYLDMSDSRNPPGVPDDYGIQPDLWEGVYIKNIGITLPEPFKRTCGSFADEPGENENPSGKPKTCRIRLDVTHLLIDEHGVDGSFAIEGQAPFIGGPIMDGEWGWNMDYINIDLQNSDIVGFGFGGGIGVPILDKDDPIDYTAQINLDNKEEYIFEISQTTDNKKSFPIWNAANVNLTNKALTIKVLDGEFDASIRLSGTLTIGDPKDKKEGVGGSTLKLPSIEFTNLEFSTKSPKIKIGGLGLNGSASASAVNFPIVPTDLKVKPVAGDKLLLSFGMILNLMKTDKSTISATGGFEVLGKLKRDTGGSQHWENESINFTGANVTVNVPQFYGTGSLNLFKGDEVYGKGFSASITAEIMGKDLDLEENTGKFSLKMAAIFGSSSSSSGETGGGVPPDDGSVPPETGDLDNYRYWMVDGLVQSDKGIPIFPPFELNGFGGGAFYHMRPDSYNATEPKAGAIEAIGESTTGVVYVPNSSTGLGLKFTTSIVAKGGLMDGLLTAIIRFSPSGTLQNITFWGTVDILKPGDVNTTLKLNIEERIPSLVQGQDDIIKSDIEVVQEPVSGVAGEDKKIKGQIGISLDFDGGFTLHGYAKVTIEAGDLLKGEATLDLLIDQSGQGTAASGDGDWHFYMGGYYKNDEQQVVVPGFFNEDELVVMEPASLQVLYGDNKLTAQCYFLTGNTIPSAPPAPAEVIAFFKDDDPDVLGDNRDGLTCGGKSPAKGTGIAFGAFAGFEIDEKIGGPFGACLLGFQIKARALVGFDLSLLKYDSETTCNQTDTPPPHGLNGFRATGRAYALVTLEGGHITCFDLPNLGVGVKVEFDLFKPSYLDVNVTAIAFGERASIGFDIGEQCGIICE